MCVPERVDSKKNQYIQLKWNYLKKIKNAKYYSDNIFISARFFEFFLPRATDFFFFTTECQFPEKTPEFSFSRPQEPMLLWTDIFREMGKRHESWKKVRSNR